MWDKFTQNYQDNKWHGRRVDSFSSFLSNWNMKSVQRGFVLPWDRDGRDQILSFFAVLCRRGICLPQTFRNCIKGQNNQLLRSPSAQVPQRCALRWMKNGALPHMLAVLGGVRLVSQLPGNQNIKMRNALSESLCEVPDTVNFCWHWDEGKKAGASFYTGSQHWGRYCYRMMSTDVRSEISF